MKYLLMLLTVLLMILLTTSCSQTGDANQQGAPTSMDDSERVNTTVNDLSQQKLAKALAIAKQKADYRLYATTGRSITFPGVNAIYFKEVNEKCGKKYMSGTGDVIRSSEQRLQRKLLVEYMSSYNQQILALCRKNKL